MKKYKNFAGIDVSKSTLDVIILNAEQPEKGQYFKTKNCKKDINAIIKKLPKDTLVCFEHTGNYGLKLSIQLAEKEIDFWIENPLLIKRFKGFKRGKSDKADAKDIAEYALSNQHKAKLYKLADDDLLKIKLLLNQRDKIVKCTTSFKLSKENHTNFPKKVVNEIKKMNKKTIAMLVKQRKLVEKQIKKVLAENQDLNDKVKLAKSVKGVGDQTAWNFLVKTKGFTCFENNWRKFACYIGTAPFEHSSGSSIKGKTKVSYYADKKMKALINMAALSAKKYDQEIKQYYQKKLTEGKNKMLINNNIRNKLIARIFAVVKRGTPYVNTQKHLAN